jgi:hypothetical protein
MCRRQVVTSATSVTGFGNFRLKIGNHVNERNILITMSHSRTNVTIAVIFVVPKKGRREEMINITASILQRRFVSGGIGDWLNVHVDEKTVIVNGL